MHRRPRVDSSALRSLALAAVALGIAACSPTASSPPAPDADAAKTENDAGPTPVTCRDASPPPSVVDQVGGPCLTSSDCTGPLVCGYAIDAGCAATGHCVMPVPLVLCCPPGADCVGYGAACGCDGSAVQRLTGEHAAAPVRSADACPFDAGADPCPAACPARGYGTCEDGNAWACDCVEDAGIPSGCLAETHTVDASPSVVTVPTVDDAGFAILCCARR